MSCEPECDSANSKAPKVRAVISAQHTSSAPDEITTYIVIEDDPPEEFGLNGESLDTLIFESKFSLLTGHLRTAVFVMMVFSMTCCYPQKIIRLETGPPGQSQNLFC